MIDQVPEEERGIIRHRATVYGTTAQGTPLRVFLPEHGPTPLLVFAGIHGHEPDSTVVLSAALRCLPQNELRAAVILCANPDGMIAGTRGNGHGIELNRNFPTTDWSPTPPTHRWLDESPSRVTLSPGPRPASEAETEALLALVGKLNPTAILSIHSPLACIDDPDASALGAWLAKRTGLPRVSDVGYPTPGSFGTWAREQRRTVVTYELEPASLSQLRERHVPALVELLAAAADVL